MSHSLLFNFDGETVEQAVSGVLTRQGFYVVRSFDLRSALAAQANCVCPHHGTDQCTCQFVVLLIYGETAQPATLTLHCRAGETRAQIADDVTLHPDPRLAEQVRAALVEAALTLLAVPP